MEDTARLIDVLVVGIEGDEGFFVNGKLIDVSPVDRRGTFIADPREFFGSLGQALGVPVQLHTLALKAGDLEGMGISATDWEWHHLEEAIQDGRISSSSTACGEATATRTVEMHVAFPDKSWSDGYYVEIPANTPDYLVRSVAGKALEEELGAGLSGCAFYGVHWIPPADAYEELSEMED